MRDVRLAVEISPEWAAAARVEAVKGRPVWAAAARAEVAEAARAAVVTMVTAMTTSAVAMRKFAIMLADQLAEVKGSPVEQQGLF